MLPEREALIRSLFITYLEMYAGRDDRLTEMFSKDFSGFAGGGNELVTDLAEWVRITRQDFSQVPEPIRIEILDLAFQDLADDVFVATGFFHFHLPMAESFLSRKTVRLVLIFRREAGWWKIVHSGISVPYGLVRAGEIYPLDALSERTRELEELVEERTRALEEANATLEALSNTDGLTGIANRRAFDCRLDQEWRRGQRTGSPLALLMLDLDNFKHFNDRYGHLAGDRCLQAVAQILAKSGRRADEIAARYGGEEFVVLLPETTCDEALGIARLIQKAVWTLALPHAGTLAGIVTVSIGVAAAIPSPLRAAEDLVRMADAALYRAKHAGRDRVELQLEAG